jgi:hypothetical protein
MAVQSTPLRHLLHLSQELVGQHIIDIYAVGERLDGVEMGPSDPLVLFHDDPRERAGSASPAAGR